MWIYIGIGVFVVYILFAAWLNWKDNKEKERILENAVRKYRE